MAILSCLVIGVASVISDDDTLEAGESFSKYGAN